MHSVTSVLLPTNELCNEFDGYITLAGKEYRTLIKCPPTSTGDFTSNAASATTKDGYSFRCDAALAALLGENVSLLRRRLEQSGSVSNFLVELRDLASRAVESKSSSSITLSATSAFSLASSSHLTTSSSLSSFLGLPSHLKDRVLHESLSSAIALLPAPGFYERVFNDIQAIGWHHVTDIDETAMSFFTVQFSDVDDRKHSIRVTLPPDYPSSAPRLDLSLPFVVPLDWKELSRVAIETPSQRSSVKHQRNYQHHYPQQQQRQQQQKQQQGQRQQQQEQRYRGVGMEDADRRSPIPGQALTSSKSSSSSRSISEKSDADADTDPSIELLKLLEQERDDETVTASRDSPAHHHQQGPQSSHFRTPLSEAIRLYRSAADKCSSLWSELEALDAHCWVLEPDISRMPALARQLPWRRLALRTSGSSVTSVTVTLDWRTPRHPPQVRVLGPEHVVAHVRRAASLALSLPIVAGAQAATQNSSSSSSSSSRSGGGGGGGSGWRLDMSVRENLTTVLGLDLLPPPSVTDKADLVSAFDCGVCYSYLPPTAVTAGGGASASHDQLQQQQQQQGPDISCENPQCNRGYHRLCLLKWISGQANVRVNMNTLFASCPYCTHPIAVSTSGFADNIMRMGMG